MTGFMAARAPACVFQAMTGKNLSEKKYRGNDLHIQK